jgi:hypothetical protein
MSTFTVHAPPDGSADAADPERFVFVRDGFYFWAFALAPLWLLAHRLWLAFVVYAAIVGAVEAALMLSGASPVWQFWAILIVELGVGLEAASIRRWTLTRRRWTTLGFVVGDDRETAEQRFFTQWVERRRGPPQVSPARGGPRGFSSDIIGLFPEAGGSP